MSDLRDYLTGLYNRKGMYDVWNRYRAQYDVIQICFIDLDNFKTVNDVYGHKAGDEMLTRFGELLSQATGEQGAVIRLGGDEFVMMFPGRYEREGLAGMAVRLFQLVKDETAQNKSFEIISVSMGIVLNAQMEEGIDSLLSYSDAAMYYAKVSGKNQYIFFDDYEDRIREEKEMEGAAVKALEEGKFQVLYYPILHLQNTKVMRTGAVAAWRRNDGTFWHRKDFESVLDRIGLIKSIDLFTVEQAFRDAAVFQKAGKINPPMGIWLSRLLLDDGIVELLAEKIDQHGLSRDKIELWVDERMFSSRGVESLLKKLQKLKEAGFRIGVIGMGAKFSSFPYLEKLPLSTLLFDPKYVDETMHTKARIGLLHALFQMASDLQFLSVAQGIDSASEAEALLENGCNAGSGRYFSKMLSAKEYGEFLSGIVERENSYQFAFQNTLSSQDGKFQGEAVGEIQFAPGISEKWGSLRFMGGAVETNLVKLPAELFEGNGYTITAWIKPREVQNWISAIYARHQWGFSSIMPSISGNQAMFRVHRDGNENWTDAMCASLPVGKWTFVAVVYDASNGVIRLFLDGTLQGSAQNVPDVGSVTMAYLGGDSYQVSFRGDVSALCIYDHPRTAEEIRRSYLDYKKEDGYCGDEPAEEENEYFVHDPAVYEDPKSHRFYLYCTGGQGLESEDLVHWKQLGKTVRGIPEDSRNWTGSDGIWAPDIVKVGEKYRLYCSNSSWGSQKSCIFLATASSPKGPFLPRQAVLKTDDTLDVNGIDANVITDHETGEQYLLYGSFFGGIHLLPLDARTGLARDAGPDGNGVGSLRLSAEYESLLNEAGQSGKGSQEHKLPAIFQIPEEAREKRRGICLARRPLWTDGSIEGPYMIYHPGTGYYYLFVSYGSLKSDYNIRVGRSRKVTGPFLDYQGKDMTDLQDETLTRGLLIHCGYRWITGMPYMGPGHNSVLLRENGDMFLVSHIRSMRLLDQDPGPGKLQIRRMFMTPDGWPIVSSQPYAEETFRIARLPVIPGQYERIELRPSIPQGISHAHAMTLHEDGRLEMGSVVGRWHCLDEYSLEFEYGPIKEFIHVEKGLDVDLNKSTVLLSGLTSQGICTWGKKHG